MSQGMAVLWGCLATGVIIGIPVFLVVFVGRRQKRLKQELAAQWSGTVIGFEYDSIRVRRAVGSVKFLVVKVLFRRQDSSEGSYRVAEPGGEYAILQTTGQPLQPPGLYDEIHKHWNEGDGIAKKSGEYYPLREP